jgi:hypothetical protein
MARGLSITTLVNIACYVACGVNFLLVIIEHLIGHLASIPLARYCRSLLLNVIICNGLARLESINENEFDMGKVQLRARLLRSMPYHVCFDCRCVQMSLNIFL